MATNYTGISFPFRLGSNGGVRLSSLNEISTDHIDEALLQSIMTKRFERTMEFHLGSELKSLTFNTVEESDKTLIIYLIQEAIKNEKRVTINNSDITITLNEEKSALTLDIRYLLNDFKVYGDLSMNINLGGEL